MIGGYYGDVLIRPIITEKSITGVQYGKYTFEVARNATAPLIRKAVEELFGVKVERVNTMICCGKRKRVRGREGMTKEWKKAIVFICMNPADKKYKTSIVEFEGS